MGEDFDAFVRLRYAELLRSAYLLTGSSYEAERLPRSAVLKVTDRWSSVDDPLPYLRPSEAETAVVLGCSVGTVKSQASRGLARLRAMAGRTATP